MESRAINFGAVIRHGERADQVNEQHDVSNKVDPPLTEKGLDQAQQAGESLKVWFEENDMKFDKVIISSSPFIRCMMTASQIAKALGVTRVEICAYASEANHPRLFKKDSHPLLEFT